MRHPSPGIAVRRAPVEPSASGDRRGVELAVTVGVVGAIGFQIFQRVVNNGYELSPYGRSLWYVSYQFGFVRRGLAGELLRRVLGHTPTVPEVAVTQNVLAVLTVAACAWLVVLLLRQRTVIAASVAALLAVSPFLFDFLGGSKRPDLVAFLLLALAAGWVATRPREPVVVGLVSGVLLALAALFSEAGPLVVGPWLALVVLACGRARARSRWECSLASALSVTPAAAVLLVVAGTGRATLRTRAALEQVAPLDVGGRGTVFPYLDDTLRDSVHEVAHRVPVWSLVVGAVLVVALGWLGRHLLSYGRDVGRWLLPTRASRSVWLVSLGATSLALFALGFDWMRWVTSIACAASLATAAIVVVVDRAVDRPAGSDAWHRPLPTRVALSVSSMAALGVAVYLLVLPPLPTAVRGVGEAAHLLMNAPGR